MNILYINILYNKFIFIFIRIYFIIFNYKEKFWKNKNNQIIKDDFLFHYHILYLYRILIYQRDRDDSRLEKDYTHTYTVIYPIDIGWHRMILLLLLLEKTFFFSVIKHLLISSLAIYI